jgi:hypothetical protein
MQTKNHKPSSNAIQIGAAMSKEVNFVFRIKTGRLIGIQVLTSAAVQAELESLIKCEPAGPDELQCFQGKHEFFSCQRYFTRW